jgi:cytochrome c oxidase assembly protein subunit 11
MSQDTDRHLPLKLIVLVVAMFAFGFALVPLYDVLCAVTGLNGKTANAASVVVAQPDPNRTVRVEFLASVGSGGGWQFESDIGHLDVHPGELNEAHFHVRNLRDTHRVGQAVPSIAPGTAASYFHKTECFCFTSQEYGPNEERDLKVVFEVAPELPADVDTLSLSYTYFAIPDPKD